ncbi:PP2C family protein-serine/threonine phosphatase [Streptomyces sp. NPDC085927]|uniref:PP2C family protein-serine/threonine phosphatase n=1 Tax=Streptomyces sp. NPDC085927 TaxID=3365738 RepID=UPI0037CD0B5D
MTGEKTGGADEVLGQMLREVHRTAPDDLPLLLRRHTADLGLKKIIVYVADVQQRVLVELGETPDQPLRRLLIDDSLAGWAYRTVSPRIEPDDTGGLILWLPMLDGVARIGMVAFHAPALDGRTLKDCHALASLITLIMLDKSAFSDTFRRLRRVSDMRLPAEMVWAFLPPRTIGTDLITSSAVLEPAYDLGGDCFDHALSGNTLHTAVLDAMGHDLAAGITSSVALAALRHARHHATDLAGTVTGIDATLNEVFADRHSTGILAQLETTTGHLTWANCGHPPPLLIRGRDLVPHALEREPEPPLGVGAWLPGVRRTIHHARLEPGDRVLLHTDGVTEARSAGGELFGETRFADFIIRAIASGETAPEALRRLINTILEHRDSRLNDDATILMLEWHPFRETTTRRRLP